MKLTAHGLSVTVPRGWDARIVRRAEAAVAAPHAGLPGESVVPQSGFVAPVLHLANFALPEGRGDYGSGAVERMRSGHVFAALVEFGHESVGTALFSKSAFPTIRASEISSSTMQRPIAGLGGAQRFFTNAGRPFCLYVVVGSVQRRTALVGLINQATKSIVIH